VRRFSKKQQVDAEHSSGQLQKRKVNMNAKIDTNGGSKVKNKREEDEALRKKRFKNQIAQCRVKRAKTNDESTI